MGVLTSILPKLKASRGNHKLTGKIEFAASAIDIQAAASDSGDAKPTFNLLAYTGKPMRANFYDPVIINLKGARFAKEITPVIADHDPRRRIGFTTVQAVIAEGTRDIGGKKQKGPAIAAAGTVLSTGADANEFASQAKEGFPFQVSVGADIIKGKYIKEGKTVEVNGKTWKGPLVVAEKTSIYELSILTLGADGDTVAAIAAEKYAMNEFEKWLRAMHFDPEELTDEQRTSLKAAFDKSQAAGSSAGGSTGQSQSQPIQAAGGGGSSGGNPGEGEGNNGDFSATLKSQRKAAADEVKRVSGINRIAASYANLNAESGRKIKLDDGKEYTLVDLQAKAIEDEWAPETFELHCLRASRTEPTGPAIHMASQVRDLEPEVLSCAIAKQFLEASKTHAVTGEQYGYEHQYSQQALEASDHPELRRVTLHQIMNLIVARANGMPYTGNLKSDGFINATVQAMRKLQASSGFSTLEVTNIFDDVANKMLWAAYQSVNTTWQEWVRVETVSDFKTHNMYRLTSKGGYQPVGGDGELKHGGFTDEKYSIAADTYGKIVGLNRTHIINDDLGALAGIMTMLGLDGAKCVEELVYVHLLSNLATIFPTNGSLGNYISGSDSDLGIDGLSKAVLAFDNQVDADNSPIMLPADRILVGTQDKVLAGQLFSQASVQATGDTDALKFINNPYNGRFRPIVSPFLNNTSIKQRVNNVGSAISGQNSNQWFMFGPPNSPQGAVVSVAFLNGVRTPTIQQSEASFNVLGLQWRAFHDVGTATGDKKLGVMSKGAN